MRKILSTIFCLLSFASFASEYKVSLLGLESLPNIQCEVTAINDKGQVLGTYRDGSIQKIYIFDSKNGLTLIESKDDQFIRPWKLNNAGQVIGYGNNSKAFIWSKVFGIRWLDIFNSPSAFASDLNDLGQIIGTYRPLGSNAGQRPFMWDNGVVTDMGQESEFAQNIENVGFHVMDIQLTSINNKGELVGYFGYGKYDLKKHKFVLVGYKNFFWNGDMHILPLSDSFSNNLPSPKAAKVNNNGSVLVSDFNPITGKYTSYLWDLKNGLKIIDNTCGIALNDSNTILCQEVVIKDHIYFSYSIWNDGVVKSLDELLGVLDVNQMAPPYSDTYDIERIESLVNINNKGQIPCMGWIWGDQYPCMLEPNK